MEPVQFGDKWVQVKNTVFYVSDPELFALKAWYVYTVNHKAMTEEEIAEELEYLAKAFTLLNIRSKSEALHYMSVLDYAYEMASEIKEVIDRAYAVKTANAWVSEL